MGFQASFNPVDLIVNRPVPSCSMIITFTPRIPYAEKVWNDLQAASTRPYRNFL